MYKVEIVVEYGLYDRELLKFKRWLIGWLYDRYGVLSEVVEGDGCVVYEVDGDLFELFNELRVETKLMLRDVKADVKAVGVCGGGECVVVDDFRFEMVLSDRDLKKLEKVVNRVGRLVGYGKVEGIEVVNRGGKIVVDVAGCRAKLYVNEAFVVAADLVRFVEDVSGLELVKGVRLIHDIFEPPEPRSLNLDFMTDEGSVMLFIDSCSRDLKIGEALKLSYWLMYMSLNELKLRKVIEKWGYE